MKGASSREINIALRNSDLPFRWQGGYAALTVSRSDVELVGEYVRQQRDRHRAGDLHLEWELPIEPDD